VVVHVCQPLIVDTSIETPNETSGEVALKTSDPAEWEITPDLIHNFAKHIPSQNIEFDFFLKGRSYGDKVRYMRKEYFIRRLTNGEIVQRDWLIYSPSTGKTYCYVCKLFNDNDFFLILQAIYVFFFRITMEMV
jgi:hypothetical protein